jgi:hypothetical protein
MADDINDMASYIWRRARDFNVNPAVALGIAKSEGLNPKTIGSPTFGNRDAKGYSYGPFQLYSGSSDPNKIAPGGMAYEFVQKYGEAPSAANWQQQVDFSLERMANKGTRDWYAVRDRGGIENITKIGDQYAKQIGLDGGQPVVAPPAGATPPWSNAASALGDLDQKYLNGGLGFIASPITNLLGMAAPQSKEPSPIGFVEPKQMMGATLPQSLMGPQPAGGVGPMATAGGGQAAMAAVPLAQPSTGWSMDAASLGNLGQLASLGSSLMAAGARKPMQMMAPGPINRGKWRDDIFAGLLG